MIIVLLACIICLLLTYLDMNGRLKNGLAYGFVVVTIIVCIRYDYGTDYINYYKGFLDFFRSNFTLHDVFYGDIRRNNEYGWSFILWIFSHAGENGFFILNIALGVFENVVLYYFIKKRIDKRYWFYAVFVYLFTSSFYLLSMTMFRQWLAVCIFVLCFSFIERKKIIISFSLILIASTIHRSSVLLFPFALFGLLPIKQKKIFGFVFLALFLVLSISSDALNTLLELSLGIETVEGYMGSYADQEVTSSRGLGFMLNLIPFIVSIYYLFTDKSENRNYDMLVLFSCLGTLLIPFSANLQMVQRLSLYFQIFTIASVPITYNNISNKVIRSGLIFIYIFMHLYGCFLFFQDPSYSDKYVVYKTIFSVI